MRTACRRLFVLIALVALIIAAPLLVLAPPDDKPAPNAPPSPAAPAPNSTDLHGQTFTLPPGFTVESAAADPLVRFPITMALDESGRLYVTECFGAIQKSDVEQQKKIHRIVRLEDSDNDGKFDNRIVFADQILFPEGTMWLDGSLYVAAPPSIWKFTDKDGDGVADERVEWFKGGTLTGCANDLHGPYRGHDGWIYWTKGAFAKQTYERPGRKPLITRASHIFRARPDGSGVEAVMTGGMDNPVDVAFTAAGEMILSNTFIQHPAGGKRDGLLHAVHGGVYGKEHDPLYEHPWTGPDLLPIMTHHGPSATAGLVCAQSSAWGDAYADNFYACLFNLHRITRHVLVSKGATFTTKDEDFFVSSSADFHPTDIIEDADGSLLIADTGGWYKLCCPTSQLVKPDVLGGIYRVRKDGAAKIEDPRGMKIEWNAETPDNLVDLLNDARPIVRQRAGDRLVAIGDEAIAPLRRLLEEPRSAVGTGAAMWALIRIDKPDARRIVRDQIASKDAATRQIALHGVSLWRDREVTTALIGLLQSGSALDRRLAAQCLGRIGEKTPVPALLGALSKAEDRFVEHAIIHALIEIGDAQRLAETMEHRDPSIRRGAMIALDQMARAGHLENPPPLDAAPVIDSLASADARLRETAGWIIARHPEWGGRVAEGLGKRLAEVKVTTIEGEEMRRQLAALSGSPEIQALLVTTDPANTATVDATRLALKVMATARVKQVPQAWTAWLTTALTNGSAAVQVDAVVAARSLPWGKERPAQVIVALLKIADDDKADADARLAALSAVPGGVQEWSASRLSFVLGQLDRDQPALRRAAAVETLIRSKLNVEQLTAITETLDRVAATEINQVLDTFTQSTDAALGMKLIAALKKAPAFSALRGDHVVAQLAKYGPDVQREAAGIAASLNADLAEHRTRLERMLTELPKGDINRGHVIFRGAKVGCTTCHATGYVGGNIGPDLTRIGAVRTERDLLESILFPSLSFVQGYEPWVVMTTEGDLLVGRLTKNAPDEIVLQGANREFRLPRDQVAEMKPGKVSIMPTGLEQQISRQDLADLLAFLKACK